MSVNFVAYKHVFMDGLYALSGAKAEWYFCRL